MERKLRRVHMTRFEGTDFLQAYDVLVVAVMS